MRFAWLRSPGLSVKFALTITAVVAGVAFTIGAVMVTLDWKRFQLELENSALLLAHSVSVTAADYILQNDYWSLFKSLKKLTTKGPGGVQETLIVTAMIIDPEGNILAHLQPSENPLGLPLSRGDTKENELWLSTQAVRAPTILSSRFGKEGFLEGVVPIFSDQILLGFVRVRLSYRELFLKAQRSAMVIVGLTLGLVLLGSLLGTALSRRMTKPLTAMTQGIEALGRGELATISPIAVSDNDEIGLLTMTFNKIAAEMAEKKTLEEQVAVSEKLVALGRISAGVAHEVNNPLAGMMNCIDTLKKHPNDPELVARYLPLLDKGLNRIKGIVQSLLIELHVEDTQATDSAASLDELRELIASEIGGRDIQLAWDNQLDEAILIDKIRVQQIILNLLKNAIQAVTDDGTVSFTTYQDGDYVTLIISDDGEGISADYRKQIFDPFFTTKINGTGLGLWIVYRLVECMHGIIEVDSELAKGTRFVVTLPCIEASTS
ncbi:MAG: ATP-binding protein [Motiliproteus sp.]